MNNGREFTIHANQIPKGIKSLTPGFDPMSGKGVVSFVEKNPILHIETALIQLMDEASASIGHGAWAPSINDSAQSWVMMIGYLIIDEVSPRLRKRGEFNCANTIMERLNNFASEYLNLKREAVQSFMRAMEREKDFIFFDEMRAVEEAMIDLMQQPDKGNARIEKYETFVARIAKLYKGYNFTNFFREFAKHVAKKPEDVNLLYCPDNHAASVFVMMKTIEALEMQGKFKIIRRIENMPGNRDLMVAA